MHVPLPRQLSLPLSSTTPSASRRYLRLLDSPRDSPTVYSLALLLVRKHASSLSHFSPFPSKLSLSCYLILPSRRAISRSCVYSFLFLSSSLSLTNSLTLYKQGRVYTRACVRSGMCGGSSCARARILHVYATTMVHLFFCRFTERHTRGGTPDFFSFSVPSLSSLPYLSLSHARSRYAHRNCVR